jgi:hypothetical protein
MRNQRVCLLVILLTSCVLAGCGTVVPDIKEAWDSDIPGDPAQDRAPIAGAGQIEFEIKKQIYCELRRAVRAANKYYITDEGKNNGPPAPFLPKDWGAFVSLSLQVDESSAINPGVAFNTPMANAISTFGVVSKTPVTTSTPQLFSLGVGGTLSSTATRNDKFDPYYTIADLSKPVREDSVCNVEKPKNDPFVDKGFTPAKSSPLIYSDLGLEPWLIGALFTDQSIPSVVGPPAPEKKQLADERNLLRTKGFTSSEITQIVASGALSSDVTILKSKGYSPSEIGKYLGEGASPIQLEELKKEGYEPTEIAQIISKVKASASKQGGSGGGGSNAPDTISIEIKFIIVSSGNVTPTWKLLRISANAGSAPLFGMGRTRTHDLIITIGPNNLTTANTHLASQIGNAVANSNQAALATPSPSPTFTPFTLLGF